MDAKDILKRYKTTQSTISEVLVKESKRDIESWLAIEQIKQYLKKNGIKRKEHSQLEQTLNRLEQLEKANIELSQKSQNEINYAINEISRLKQENQELKNWNEKYLSELKRWGYPEIPIHISEYKKLKKEIEDLNAFVDAYANAREELLIRNQNLEKEINTLNALLSDTKESYINVLKENQELQCDIKACELCNWLTDGHNQQLIEENKQLEKENQELKEDLRLTTIERTNCENTFEELEEQYLKCKNVIKNEITLLEERKESYYYSEWYDTAKVIGIIIDELKEFLCNV